MRFFSGFSFHDEAPLFGEMLEPYRNNPYVVAGFSYGAQRALEHVHGTDGRVERLLLLSPAWFCDKSDAFKKLQLRAFRKDPAGYLARFYAQAAYPAGIDLGPYKKMGSYEELDALLHYPWYAERLEAVAARGVKIEIYLGAEDRIVDAPAAHDFFKNFGESWLFKHYGHILQGENDGYH
ncbi:pimelyl-ACP methyl ester esterase BioV [Hydrogenimonas sp.]